MGLLYTTGEHISWVCLCPPKGLNDTPVTRAIRKARASLSRGGCSFKSEITAGCGLMDLGLLVSMEKLGFQNRGGRAVTLNFLKQDRCTGSETQ